MANDPSADPFRPSPPPPSGDDTTWAPTASVPGPATGPSTDPFGTQVPAPAPAAPVPAARPRSRSGGAGLLLNVLLGIALVVAVGGVAFAAGRVTAPTTAAANGNGGGRFGNGGGPFFGGPNASGAPNGNGGFAGNGGFVGAGGVAIEGTVTAISADSVTLQLANGQSVTIPIDAQTTYHSRSAATAADVTTGSTVQVQLQGGGGRFGNGGGNAGNGNGNGGPAASGQPARSLPTAGSITLVPAGS